MNFLAHIFLSDNSPEVMIGNFIADFIRGNQFYHLPEGVIKGIKLHRAIDDFTDSHEIVRYDIKLLHPYFGRYSGIVVDIFYDHLLLCNWEEFSNIDKQSFISNFYEIVDNYFDIIPIQLKEIFPNMKNGNWLLNYGNMEGLNRTFLGMSSRVHGNADFSTATQLLEKYFTVLDANFRRYFPELIEHVQHYRLLLN